MSEARDLLIEIGTEELPPTALRGLMEAFAAELGRLLEEAGLGHAGIQPYATPRRLAVVIAGLAERQAEQHIERKGPALKAAFDEAGNPTRAAQGFARSCGVEVAALEQRPTDKGTWLYYSAIKPGRLTAELLPTIITTALARLPIPKRMRWGAGDAEFVRPVHWVVVLHGEQTLPTDILGIEAGGATRGHRFHSPRAIAIPRPADYVALLREAYVLADFEARRQSIEAQVTELARSLGGRPLMDTALLDEVTALVEWPVAQAGSFDARFLEMPAEALITTMQDNQKYFPVVDNQGRLLAHFIFIANIESHAPAKVRAGNERVIHPRFSDAAFFWQQDRSSALIAKAESLSGILFHQRLGTLQDKSRRLVGLARAIAQAMDADTELAERAAALSKCDLMTELVQEFPALQGTMGRYYAAYDGEPEAVANALDEQYQPRQAGGALPAGPTGQVLALADRLDTLVGIFAIGLKPTGVKDPFGLRRASLGVLRILIEVQLELDLEWLLQRAAEGFIAELNASEAVPAVFDYIQERTRAYYNEQGYKPDVIEAVLALRPTRPLDLERRIQAVTAFRQLPEAASLTAANKRIRNILKDTQDADAGQVDPSLFESPAERTLYDALEEYRRLVEPLFEAGDYASALTELAGLHAPVDQFFDEVMVMAEDAALKANRLGLLARLSRLFLRAADLSRLQANGKLSEAAR